MPNAAAPPPTEPPPEADPRWLDSALAAAADALDRPLLVLRRDARVVWCNAAARTLLASDEGDWRLAGDERIAPRGPTVPLAWSQALGRAADPGERLDLARVAASLPPGQLLPLAQAPAAQAWLLLLPRPMPPQAPPAAASSAALGDYSRRLALDDQQSALLAALARRTPMRQLASEMHVSPSTLRRRALDICRKAELASLPALRRELQGLPPLRG